MKKNFNIGENIRFGMGRTLKNFWFFALFISVLFIGTALFSFFDNYQIPGILGLSLDFIISASSFLATYVIFMAILKIALELTQSEKINLKEVNELLPLFVKFTLTTLLYWAIVLIGMVFLIVPGIIFMIKYQFASLIILDEEGVGIREALHKSNLLASGVQWKLFWFSMVSDFLNFAGLIFFMVGFIITGPTTIIAKARIYKELKRQVKGRKKTVFLQD